MVLLIAIATAAVVVVQAQRRWRVVTRTDRDGTLVVAVARPGLPERVVKALPPGLDPYDLGAELELAREEAAATAAALNRG